MRALFEPGGAVAAAVPRYEPRPQQAALAEAVADALERREHLVAEAGTGTGKSLAYLVPALESGRRVVVSTATKALQEQLLTSDVPLAARVLGRNVDVAVLKGRQNYVCRRSVHGFELLGGILLGGDDGAQLDRLRPWLESTRTGDRAELEFEPADSLWAELAVGAERCQGRRCPFFGTCFAEAARARAAEADLVIANHALYFADLGVRSRSDGVGVLPEHDAVVFDEAHRLEEAAASWLGGRVTAYGLDLLARDVDRACRDAAVAVPARALDRVARHAAALLAAVTPPSGRRRLRHPAGPAGEALELALDELAEALRGRGEELDALARRTLELAATLAACMAPDVDRVVWAEPGALAWAPVDVSETLRELLWEDDGPTAVLVSATIGVAGDARFLRRRLGLVDALDVALDSPFDFREQALLYLARGMPDPRAPDAVERVASEIVALCRLSRGRALVLTSSYRVLGALAERVRGRLPQAVLVQGDAPRERLLARFRSDVDSILLATSTFWQGIDVPGESLSLLVIDKLPFAAPGDPLVEARCERISAHGGNAFGEYLLPAAVLQLRQGFGRLIRSHDDRGVVAILDPRVRTRAYGRVFVDSLPAARVTDDRAVVAGFFADGARMSA